MHVVYERCAAIDVGKDEIAVAVRMPGDGPDGRVTVKRTFKTFYGVLGEAARWLVSLGVTHVAMEATGSYSLPVYYALLEHGDFAKVLICNAGHVKNVPAARPTMPMPNGWRTCWSAGCWPAASSRRPRSRPPGT
jgi:transposase